MVTGFIITNSLAAAAQILTPVQRWQAARQLNTNFMLEPFFAATLAAVSVAAVVLFAVFTYNQHRKQQKAVQRSFADYAEKRGLSRSEQQTLLDIAENSGLKRSEAIFTMDKAFDAGAAKMIKVGLAKQRMAEKSKRLRIELLSLREKLGFQKRTLPSIGPTMRSGKMSSRQIPVGKKLNIVCYKVHGTVDLEAVVIKNSDMELTVKLPAPIEAAGSRLWRLRYYFGALVWEFDSLAVSCKDNILVLNHNDNVRVINRRRFLRAPVNKSAFIAPFPFTKTFAETDDNDTENPETDKASTTAQTRLEELPEFVPAAVTEIAGSGLRLNAPLQVNTGDKVLVVFRLNEEKNQDVPLLQRSRPLTSKIIEDIGVVRHIEPIPDGYSIAVELIGLNDSDVNELICAANAACLNARTKTGSTNKTERLEELAVARRA